VQAGEEERALRRDLRAGERHPERVRAEHDHAVVLGVVEQVVEQLRDPHPRVHPAVLLRERQLGPGHDGVLEDSALREILDHGWEAADRQPVLDLHTGLQHVLPGEMVGRAGGEDLDVPAALVQSHRHLPHDDLGPAGDARPVPRGHERQLSGARAVDHKISNLSGALGIPSTGILRG
jgi:hypothetical protein